MNECIKWFIMIPCAMFWITLVVSFLSLIYFAIKNRGGQADTQEKQYKPKPLYYPGYNKGE